MPTKIQLIKEGYKKIKGKTLFISEVAALVGNSPKSLRNNWFSEFWSIPAQHQDTVMDAINKKLEQQKQIA